MVRKLNENNSFIFTKGIDSDIYIKIIDNVLNYYSQWKCDEFIINNPNQFTQEDVEASKHWSKVHKMQYMGALENLNDALKSDGDKEADIVISEYISKYGI